jgi:hypothetical protein
MLLVLGWKRPELLQNVLDKIGNFPSNIFIWIDGETLNDPDVNEKVKKCQSIAIQYKLNNPNTYIFLSAGGNNILTHYVDKNEDATDTSVLKPMFGAYKNLIKSIQARLPEAKIILLDIYYPNNLQYKQFHSIIKEWNSMIYDFAENPKNNIYSVIKISSYLTQNDDFSFGIEPSSSGGKKIADLILSV